MAAAAIAFAGLVVQLLRWRIDWRSVEWQVDFAGNAATVMQVGSGVAWSTRVETWASDDESDDRYRFRVESAGDLRRGESVLVIAPSRTGSGHLTIRFRDRRRGPEHQRRVAIPWRP